MKSVLQRVLLAGLLLALSTTVWGQTAGQLDCQSCHTDKAQSLKNSAHASLSCTDCHSGIKTFPHPKDIELPKCSQCHAKQATEYAHSIHGVEFAKGNKAAPTCQVCHGDAHEVKQTTTWAFKKSIPELCGACHVQPLSDYQTSIHGQAIARGVFQAPVCTSCHTAHSILPPTSAGSTVFATHIPETCGQCHGNVKLATEFNIPRDRLLSYDASFHGLAVKEGSETAANCASCHGFHLILPSSDPRSSINPKNLPKTCGKCHPGAGDRFAIGPVHELPGLAEPVAVRWVRGFYLFLIPFVIGLMTLHNLGDWIRKLKEFRFGKPGPAARESAKAVPAEDGEVRMYRFERLEHFLLLISFILLVWTGFALKYPNGWWSRPLLMWGAGFRGLLHRVAAVVFIAVGVIHVISLIKSRRLREHWLELWPKVRDIHEGMENFAYNLGLRRKRPARSGHSYVEKAEYWAVVWGAVVMGITGLMLWAHNLVLAWLPKSFLDFAGAVHFYEAVLAGLAILVWHFYSVIFDPEVYPMDSAWLTGRSVKHRERESAEPGLEDKEDTEGENDGNEESDL
jgi:cytochrome b subunit of formate dehydrogenase